MNCQSFDARLDALLEGRCTPAEWSEAEAHLAACARCRPLFDAMSGRGGDLDDEGHDALATAIVEKTSGSGRACASARERLCAFVDGELEPFDRNLVAGHLSRCAACAALTEAVAEQTQVLRTFATLAPRTGFVRDVLAATSRKPVAPTATEKIAAWLARAAQRPRFAVEAAYVMTVLLLVVFGNPVAAFREASVRVQPRVSAVAGAVSRPLGEMRAAGANRLSRVERALAPKAAAADTTARSGLDGLLDSGIRWVQSTMLEPLQSLVTQIGSWAWRVLEDLRRSFVASPTEPPPPPAR
jgi:predicted anti-sigma-YlaC factor YlaD